MVRVSPLDKTALLRFSINESVKIIKDRLDFPTELNEHDHIFFTDRSFRMHLPYLEKVFKDNGKVTIKPILETSLSSIAKAMNMSSRAYRMERVSLNDIVPRWDALSDGYVYCLCDSGDLSCTRLAA